MEDQTGMQPAAPQAAPAVPVVKQVKELLSQDKIKEKFGEVLGQKAPQFMASITNTVSGSAQLKKCPANSIIGAAFVAATYDLPIDSKRLSTTLISTTSLSISSSISSLSKKYSGKCSVRKLVPYSFTTTLIFVSCVDAITMSFNFIFPSSLSHSHSSNLSGSISSILSNTKSIIG